MKRMCYQDLTGYQYEFAWYIANPGDRVSRLNPFKNNFTHNSSALPISAIGSSFEHRMNTESMPGGGIATGRPPRPKRSLWDFWAKGDNPNTDEQSIHSTTGDTISEVQAAEATSVFSQIIPSWLKTPKLNAEEKRLAEIVKSSRRVRKKFLRMNDATNLPEFLATGRPQPPEDPERKNEAIVSDHETKSLLEGKKDSAEDDGSVVSLINKSRSGLRWESLLRNLGNGKDMTVDNDSSSAPRSGKTESVHSLEDLFQEQASFISQKIGDFFSGFLQTVGKDRLTTVGQFDQKNSDLEARGMAADSNDSDRDSTLTSANTDKFFIDREVPDLSGDVAPMDASVQSPAASLIGGSYKTPPSAVAERTERHRGHAQVEFSELEQQNGPERQCKVVEGSTGVVDHQALMYDRDGRVIEAPDLHEPLEMSGPKTEA